MDPEAMRHCLGFGFSNKAKSDIGQYGNGFKTSTMRLGADVIVFSRNKKMRTQSVGLLSYTSLTSLGHNKIIVPMVDYEFDASVESFRPIMPNGMANFQANLSLLLDWCPYSTEEELLKQVITTIGFLKEASDVKVYGFNIYHRNRLILPFWRVLKNVGGSNRRGIVGVMEANCIEPTHNKQDFEKTSLFQKLEERLKLMTVEYWQTHRELIGHQVISPSTSAVPSHEIHSVTHIYSKEHASVGIESSGATSAGSDSVARRPKGRPRKNQIRIQLGSRQNQNVPPVSQECAADTCNVSEEQPNFRSENELECAKLTSLLQENKKLRKQISELENRVEGFNLKEEKLRSELNEVQSEYARLVVEFV